MLKDEVKIILLMMITIVLMMITIAIWTVIPISWNKLLINLTQVWNVNAQQQQKFNKL
jgi:uncharacterized membrane protein (Fun14 family)